MTNTWIGVGRLARDPELRYADSGTTGATMRLAVDRAGGDDEAGFFDIACFGKTAEAVGAHLVTGRRILVEGSLRQSTWNDNETGQRRSRVEIVARQVTFLDAPRREDSDAAA